MSAGSFLRRLMRRADPDAVDSVDVTPDGVDLLTNDLKDAWRQFTLCGDGHPGATQENEYIWVIRDHKGRPVGGARVFAGPPPSIDVEIAPKHRRKGYATALYEALDASGFDTDGASDQALRTRMMTPLGYAFMVGRRRKRAASAGGAGEAASASKDK